MSSLFPLTDTDDAVSSALLEKIRNTPLEERLRQMILFCQFGRDLVEQDIRRQFPNLSEQEFKRQFLTRLYGEEFAERACRGAE